MGIEFSKFCCGKEHTSLTSSSSSPQHLLSTPLSSSSQPFQKKAFGNDKLDACFSALDAKKPSVVHYRARLISLQPLALLIPNFLKPEECQALILLASPFLKPSRVCGEGLTADRSSSSMFFSGPLQYHPAVINLQARLQSSVSSIAATLGRNTLKLTEALQVVKYSEGESYALHRDNDTEEANGTLQRAATAIIYLSSSPFKKGGGGHTIFPNASASLPRNKSLETNGVKYLERSSSEGAYCSGFSVQPRQGHVLLFWSALPNGKEDLAALHEAAPVLCGEKFIATHWFAEISSAS